MYQTRELERISRQIGKSIEEEISRVGIFFRIFNRVKDSVSFEDKILRKGAGYYDGKEKFVRDIIGIRIILYFSDDIDIVYERLKKYFEFVEETIDKNEETKFAPTRINIVFRLPENTLQEFKDIVRNVNGDTTFEVQLRTILSEGWHEIDHDLRYKCIEDWEQQVDLARNFNGILAALETSEYSILRLFEQLSYRHYKSKDFDAMLRTKFRLRMPLYHISEALTASLTDAFIRDIFKINRLDLLTYLFDSKILIPLSIDNLIYVINYKFVKNEDISKITPKEILNELKQL